jgi:outer membrane protein TolC
VTARANEEVVREAEAAYEAHLTDARHRQELGLAARNEVLAVEVERDRAVLTRLRAQSQRETAEADLARLLKLPPGETLEPVEPIESAPVPEDDLEAQVASALAHRPERQAAEARVKAATAQAESERGARLPQVMAAAGYDYANPNRKFVPPSADWKGTWDVSVQVAFDLFDGGRNQAAVARARARAEARRQQLADIDGQLRLQVTRMRAELRTAEASVKVALRKLDSARENHRVASDRYREGLLASSDLLDAEVALLQAGLDLVQSRAQARLAAAGLERAIGKTP